jgi:hypothetical protein
LQKTGVRFGGPFFNLKQKLNHRGKEEAGRIW